MASPDDRLVVAVAQAEASPDGLLVVSPEGRMVFWNARFCEIWGFPPEWCGSHDDARALREATARVLDPESFLEGAMAAYRDPVQPLQDEIELIDGRILDRYGAPLRSAEGDYLGWAWYFRDVTLHRRNERDLQELAHTLQASLLPPRPPTIPGLDLATRYLPADDDVGVGGDFYDVFRISPQRWGICIGDVCGKGARAASLTTLTRYGIRAAAVHHPLPSLVLSELNAALLAEPESDDRFCSVVYADVEVDTCGAWVTLSCGGHPRPIVVRRAGWIDVRGQTGTLIGLFDDPAVDDDRVGLGPGDAIVFCTDGITEARNGDGQMFGEEALPAVLLDHAGAPADVLAAALLDAALSFSDGRRHDDIAVLVVRVPTEGEAGPPLPTPPEPVREVRPVVGDEYAGLRQQRPAPPREARVQLPVDPRSAAAARRFLAGVLASWRMPQLVGGDAELLISELASNAVRHARSAFTIVVRYDGEVVRVEVGDGSRVVPVPRAPTLEDTGGRGLFLVETLARAWGVVPTLGGKRVWFEVAAPPLP